MKKLKLLSFVLIFIIVPRFVFSQPTYPSTTEKVFKEPTFEEREELIMASGDSLLQPQNKRMFVRREKIRDQNYFIFYVRDTNDKWNHFDTLEYPLSDIWIDFIFFDGEDGIILGCSRSRTVYHNWIRSSEGWIVKSRD